MLLLVMYALGMCYGRAVAGGCSKHSGEVLARGPTSCQRDGIAMLSSVSRSLDSRRDEIVLWSTYVVRLGGPFM
jgi:hypothetical protein